MQKTVFDSVSLCPHRYRYCVDWRRCRWHTDNLGVSGAHYFSRVLSLTHKNPSKHARDSNISLHQEHGLPHPPGNRTCITLDVYITGTEYSKGVCPLATLVKIGGILGRCFIPVLPTDCPLKTSFLPPHHHRPKASCSQQWPSRLPRRRRRRRHHHHLTSSLAASARGQRQKMRANQVVLQW